MIVVVECHSIIIGKKNTNHKMDLDLSSKCYESVVLGRATSIDCLY